MSQDTPPSECISILCLDGGGVRGLSSLLILREYMKQLAGSLRQKGITPVEGKSLRPCDCFRLIAGAGTGGISALLLGKLRLTVDEAIVEYSRMANLAFKRPRRVLPTFPWSPSSQSLFDGDELESYLKGLVNRVLGNADSLMADPQGPSTCVTVVLAATSDDVSAPPYVFRSDQTDNTFTIVEVARATSAFPGIFPPASVGSPSSPFIDAGAVGYSNPAEIALNEANDIWGAQEFLIFSIGTGLQPIIEADCGPGYKILAKISKQIVHSCEQVHEHLMSMPDRENFWYFRFNLSKDLTGVVKEWKTPFMEKLTGITLGYLRKAQTRIALRNCILFVLGEISLSNRCNSAQEVDETSVTTARGTLSSSQATTQPRAEEQPLVGGDSVQVQSVQMDGQPAPQASFEQEAETGTGTMHFKNLKVVSSPAFDILTQMCCIQDTKLTPNQMFEELNRQVLISALDLEEMALLLEQQTSKFEWELAELDEVISTLQG